MLVDFIKDFFMIRKPHIKRIEKKSAIEAAVFYGTAFLFPFAYFTAKSSVYNSIRSAPELAAASTNFGLGSKKIEVRIPFCLNS